VTIVFYITGHGFGHASRSIELLNTIAARRPGARIIVRTSAPAWLFRATAPAHIELGTVETDVGVIQIDSLNVDEHETARRAAAFYGDFDRRVDEEAAFLDAARATVVIGDIPPLAFAAAARARVPSVAVGNFTWDWIYSGYEAFRSGAGGVGGVRGAEDVIATIRAAYSTATRALRLPLHGGFDAMAAVTTDIPFIARRSRLDPAETRARLGIASDRPFVLASFSAADLDLPYDAIAEAEHLTILAPAREPPASLTYPDLVAAADVVVSKPGYGIVSECVANGTALLYTSRGRFIEYDVFVAEMPRVLRCRYLAREDFLSGRWGAAVRALLAQTPPPERAQVDGARIAAEAILDVAIV
jgi:L-arabinokinase